MSSPQVLQLLDLLLAAHDVDGLDADVLGVLDEHAAKDAAGSTLDEVLALQRSTSE